MTMQLETTRLILRPPQLSDADTIFRYVSDYAIARTTLNIPHPYPRAAVDEFITRMNEAHAEQRGFTFAATLRTNGALIGMCGIHPDTRFDRAEIGYWIGLPFWRKGYASEATRRLIDFGFSDLQLQRVFATYFATNIASRRVMEKAGMTYEATVRQHIKRLGVYHDLGFCGILRAEWLAQRAAAE